ncbi:hypothetical protein PPERSA_00614 [Pseudocohnilembus persalinus]|uniref:Uncharacterized protein n=1 Tax=Pseudocohnilembus persalinus TaxID=266149 RepID=A0A0V0QSX6_PSEPJ|nr:hypothetical protein PPERSA_00614 [Pseudocohnilembus persalinus]|eukprot:KRX05313.1 hypothetical protein PPERSA_00614 [Pseudocohnilembus persalinus]
MNRKKPLKAEQSSDRMISLLRKEKRDNFEVLTRTGNIRIEKPVNGVPIKEKDKLKMFRTPGKHGKFMQPIIDVSEFENLQIVHKKVIDNLGFKKRYENSFLEQFDKKQEESIDDDKKNQNSYIGAGNFSNVQEIYIAKEKERQKQKRYKKMLKIQKQKQQEEEDDAYKNADGDKENKNKSLNINSKNPYIINKEKNDQIYKQLYIFTRDRNTINKLTQNKNYKNDLNISRQDVQTAKAVGKRRERFNSETFYGQSIAHGFTTTHKSQQNNFYRQEYDEVLEENLPIFLTDQQEVKEEQQYAFEQYERQCIISMVSGQPVNPYIALPTLQEQLENKNKHFKFESKKFFDDLDLQQMPEFEGFDFQEAKKEYLKRMGLKNMEKNKNKEEQAQQLIKNTIEQEGQVVRLVGKYLIEQQKGTINYFESFDAFAEKEFQNMIKHKKKLYQYYGNQYNISLTIQNIKGQTNNINNKSNFSRKSIQQRSISYNIPTQESQI